ncbi:DUF4158 domain-containing protein [Streptomyces sp. NPDC001093]|uniref:DUF4158 domain-containing protein n=1 Tax=Streptomyces sp. NPDC001093 TaxID=3154376 RepID=UPI003324F9BE
MGRLPVGMDDLVEHWTVLDDERELVAGKRGAKRLGFALLLKYYTQHGRFPRGRTEFLDEVVGFVARQMKVSAADFGLYECSGGTIEYHRAQICEHLCFQVCSVQGAKKLTDWLAMNVAHAERNADRVREEPAGVAGVRQHPGAPRCARRIRMGRSACPADRRGLTPLFWSHVRPYGEGRLGLGSRLGLGTRTPEGEVR